MIEFDRDSHAIRLLHVYTVRVLGSVYRLFI